MATIRLDQERPLRWTMRTDFRIGGLAKPPALSDIGSSNPRRAFHALCCFVWACLPSDSPFAEPDSVADHLDTAEKQIDAIKALHAAIEEAGLGAKKKPSETTG